MAAKIDLSKMTMDDLKSLRKDLDKAISEFENRKRSEAMKEIQAVAKKHGIALDEIVGSKPRKAKAKSPAKFRNPSNADETWSGRGRQPEWYKTAVASGTKPEKMKV